jgi:hypothetical protein
VVPNAAPRALITLPMTGAHATGRQRTGGDGNLPSGNSKYNMVAVSNKAGNKAHVDSQAAYCTPGSRRALTFSAQLA